MNVILFDDPDIRKKLLPLTFGKSISALRLGIFTIKEKWEWLTGHNCSTATAAYLSGKYRTHWSTDNFLINSAILPDPKLWEEIKGLAPGHVLSAKGITIALHLNEGQSLNFLKNHQASLFKSIAYSESFRSLERPWDLFRMNGDAIVRDFELLGQNRKSQKIQDPYTRLYQEDNIFIEEDCDIKAAVINASKGPVYIGKGVTIQENAVIQGPSAICEGAQVNIGAKIRPFSTLGPYCKVGGEVNNVIFQGYSNKAHDGFLGNAVLGEWCNLGADTNASNLKNTFAEVKAWSYFEEDKISTGGQFCGLIMGDHGKAGINTMFNTGTIVGLGANIFGEGFPPTFIPSFAWGGAKGFEKYRFDKFLEAAEHMMSRRNVMLDESEIAVLRYIFERSYEITS